jgi:hypothetical protein
MDSVPPKSAQKVFISYAHDTISRWFSGNLRSHLHHAGIETWQDINELRVGLSWSAEIDAVIKDCLAVIPIFTEAAAQSQYVTYEWSFALGLGKPILPVWLSGDDSLHIGLKSGQFQALDMRDPRQSDAEVAAKFDQLVRRIRDLQARQASVEAAQAVSPPSKQITDALYALMEETTMGTPDISAVINRLRSVDIISNEEAFALQKRWRELRRRTQSPP